MKNKRMYVILVFVMLLALCGCGVKEDTNETRTTNKVKETATVVDTKDLKKIVEKYLKATKGSIESTNLSTGMKDKKNNPKECVATTTFGTKDGKFMYEQKNTIQKEDGAVGGVWYRQTAKGKVEISTDGKKWKETNERRKVKSLMNMLRIYTYPFSQKGWTIKQAKQFIIATYKDKNGNSLMINYNVVDEKSIKLGITTTYAKDGGSSEQLDILTIE